MRPCRASATCSGSRRVPHPRECDRSGQMGTTVATNALLTQGGAHRAGHQRGSATRCGSDYQNRAEAVRAQDRLPTLLYERVIEVDERMGARGEVVRPLDTATVAEGLRAAYADGFARVAIVLMHGYRYPQHERALADSGAADRIPQISVSHEVSPLMKLVSRGDTTVVDAYLSPILRRYVEQVECDLLGAESGDSARGGPRLQFMQSSGGLTDAHLFQGKDAILSGPAGASRRGRGVAPCRLRRIIGIRHGRHVHGRHALGRRI